MNGHTLSMEEPRQPVESGRAPREQGQTLPTSALTTRELDRMRAEAEQQARGFINPVALRRAQTVLAWLPDEWVTAVLGRPAPSQRTRLPWAEQLLLMNAAEVDADAVAAAHRRQQMAVRQQHDSQLALRRQHVEHAAEEWAQLAAALPVPVHVAHHYSRHHYRGSSPDRDHIVVETDLHTDRLHRTAGQALCQTPSHDLPHLDEAATDGRAPTCVACRRIAQRLAAAAAVDGIG